MIAGRLARTPRPFDLPGYRPVDAGARPADCSVTLLEAERSRGSCYHRHAGTGDWLLLAGNPIFKGAGSGEAGHTAGAAERLLSALLANGLDGLEAVDGSFAFVWWQKSTATTWLVRDRFGMQPLYYRFKEGELTFASAARDLLAASHVDGELSPGGLIEYLTYCYVVGESTLIQDLHRVAPGGYMAFDAAGKSRKGFWYTLSYANPVRADEKQIATEYRRLLEQSVVSRLGGGRAGVFLSGGMDSSSAATFMSRHLPDAFRSYSFRCGGASFDESSFARQLAAELGTIHKEVEYAEAEAGSILDAVRVLDVPFCDIGIEIGTWLLSQAASGEVDYLLTGDGGDEIWASHPVYAAQKIMRWYDRVPMTRPVRRLLAGSLDLVSDSDSKRGAAVVMKRLVPSPELSPDLGHYRWRVYHTQSSLRELLHPRFAGAIESFDPFEPVMQSFEGYDGPDDGMSQWLYGDYRTVSGFYFSRLQLAEHFGLETRLPFYDRDLVEFGARIPARLKLEGLERTKRLFRAAMEGVLPDIINHRKDKLGHSVPLKNWLRSTGTINKLVTETLQSSQFRDRELFNPDYVNVMLRDHQSKRHNHSHRLWALFVLEHWLRSHTG